MKIFDSNPDIEKNAYMNWRTVAREPLHNLSVLASGYATASLLLIENCLTDNEDKKADAVIFPILFCFNQAIELYLKEILWALNILLGEPNKKYELNHDVRGLWDGVKNCVKEFETDSELKSDFGELTQELEEYLRELYEQLDSEKKGSKNNRNFVFSRYPFDGKFESYFYIVKRGNVTINLETLKYMSEKILKNLDCIAGFYEEEAIYVRQESEN